METNREFFIAKYKELKSLNNGLKPLRNDFLIFCEIGGKKLEKLFGKDPYSKLQREAGDDPNKLELERASVSEILEKFGALVRKHQRKIVAADWMEANYSPTPDGIRVVHKIQWSELPQTFAEQFKGSSEWDDVLQILKVSQKTEARNSKRTKAFDDIVQKIEAWTPDRKRVIEEGYKIGIRHHLETFFEVEEEVGDTNPDLLINKKYPIEIKRDPTQSEYDRLLGQMVRHNKSFGSAIAIITNVSSQDRFKKFHKLFIEVHEKLGITAELILK